MKAPTSVLPSPVPSVIRLLHFANADAQRFILHPCRTGVEARPRIVTSDFALGPLRSHWCTLVHGCAHWYTLVHRFFTPAPHRRGRENAHAAVFFVVGFSSPFAIHGFLRYSTLFNDLSYRGPSREKTFAVVGTLFSYSRPFALISRFKAALGSTFEIRPWPYFSPVFPNYSRFSIYFFQALCAQLAKCFACP